MRKDEFAKRRLRQLIREELERTDLRSLVYEVLEGMDIQALVQEVLHRGETEQQRRPKLKVVQK